MKRVLFSSFLILLLFPGNMLAQRDSLRTLFLDAESWFLFEEYADALPLYMALHESDPGNDNLNYRIGICLLNDPYQKDRAIQYLLEASDNINPDYKENSFKERTAPPDVLFYLGNAYLVNELLDLAITTYEEFLGIMDREVYDEELVHAQIKACKNAKRLKTMPVDIDLTLLDSLINTRYSDIHPVISGDGSKLVFVTELPFYDGAFYCKKTDEGWSYPQMITQALGFDADIYPVGLSHDGTEMILYYDDDYIGNLYYSKFEDGRWLPATILGENISTKYWESHACFSKDGQTLYFTSNRKGTFGGLDIYKSERQPDGKWGIPENLGSNINSRYNEETPFITENGQILYFSSYGHFNMGGYDIFYSKKNADGSWGEPINLGYPINTTDDDLFFQPVNNGYGAYYSLYSPRGLGRHDIYFMDIYSADNPRMYSVSGNLRTEDGSMDSSRMAIVVVDSKTGDTVVYTTPEQESGEFSFNLPQGNYDLHFSGEGYEELIRPLNITRYSNKEGIKLTDDIELTLLKTVPLIFVGEESMIQLKDTLYEGEVGDSIEVPLRLKKGSVLITKVYQDSVLVSTDTIEIEKRRTNLKIEVLEGTSRVELELIDPDGNIHKNAFTVVGVTPIVKSGEDTDERERIEEVETDHVEGIDVDHPGRAGLLGLLLLDLEQNSEGSLHDTIVGLDPEKEGITTQSGIFKYLYDQSDTIGYSNDEVDQLLIDVVSQGDVALLYQRLLENAEGPLKEYLEQLDLEAEGIETPEDLIRHLQEAGALNGFDMDDIRKAMMKSLDQPLEVDRIYDELLKSAKDPVKEILEELNLREEGIYTVEDLIARLYRELEARGYSRRKIEKLLTELFMSHADFIKQLGQQGDRKGWPLVIVFGLGAGFFLLIILWWRRRRNNDKSTQ